jgi:hypothetical protein
LLSRHFPRSAPNLNRASDHRWIRAGDTSKKRLTTRFGSLTTVRRRPQRPEFKMTVRICATDVKMIGHVAPRESWMICDALLLCTLQQVSRRLVMRNKTRSCVLRLKRSSLEGLMNQSGVRESIPPIHSEIAREPAAQLRGGKARRF